MLDLLKVKFLVALCQESKGNFETSINEQLLFSFHVNLNSYGNLPRLVPDFNSFFWAHITALFKQSKGFGNFLSRVFNLKLDLLHFCDAWDLTILLKVVQVE